MIQTNSDQAASGGRDGKESDSAALPSARERDALLVRRFLAGEVDAFSEIMQLHSGKLFAVAFSVVRNPSDAEEIVQDTFIRAHRGLVGFRGESSLATWMYHIAANLARNRYWHSYRRHRHDARSLDAPIGDDGVATFAGMIADGAPDPAREATHHEFSALVRSCLKRLSLNQRELLTMRNTLGLSYKAIGRDLGINIGTVKSRIARARRNLRNLMLESYPAEGTLNGEAPANWFTLSRTTGTLATATR
jgi:RNA polymerase sigma-70 factor (ECF subfamily)